MASAVGATLSSQTPLVSRRWNRRIGCKDNRK